MKENVYSKITGMNPASLSYEIIRSPRKTLSLQITREGQITVRAPKRISKARIQEFVREHIEWILKKQAELRLWEEAEEAGEGMLSYTPEEEAGYRQQAARALSERAAYFAGRMGVSYGRITIRGQKTRWGSCSGKGNLNFNWKLMLCPPEIQDYVVVHELAHLKEMNHSRAFYAEVEKILPDYRERMGWLKRYGRL